MGLENVPDKSAEAGGIQWSVDKKFMQNSHLKFMTFIYNGAQNNLSARVQVYKDGQAVVSTPFKTVVPDRQDPERIPFNAEINVAGLQEGRYLLEITVEDRTSQKTASQHTAFYVH